MDSTRKPLSTGVVGLSAALLLLLAACGEPADESAVAPAAGDPPATSDAPATEEGTTTQQ